MRIPLPIAVIGVAGLSVLATALMFRLSNSDAELTAPTSEQALQQEIDQLHHTISSLTTALNRINLNPGPATATPANDATSMSRKPAAPTPASKPAGMADASSTKPERPAIIMVNPTPEQQAVYDKIIQRFDDPYFVRTLTMDKLSRMEELATLPQPLAMLIFSKALEKYNNGEVDKSTFYPNGGNPP